MAIALLEQPRADLTLDHRFKGAGIYAIYYTGDYPAYEAVRCGADREVPIYVGKAVPQGARKGGFGLGISPGYVLYSRLMQHAQSVDQTTNLELADFYCRYLVVDDIWIPLGESLLIERFSPIWNKVIDGFGNHDPGSGRYQQQMSAWDVLHTGRPWADKCRPNIRSADDVLDNLHRFLVGEPAEIVPTPHAEPD